MRNSRTITISWRRGVFFAELGAFFHVTIVRQVLQIDEAWGEGFVQVRSMEGDRVIRGESQRFDRDQGRDLQGFGAHVGFVRTHRRSVSRRTRTS